MTVLKPKLGLDVSRYIAIWLYLVLQPTPEELDPTHTKYHLLPFLSESFTIPQPPRPVMTEDFPLRSGKALPTPLSLSHLDFRSLPDQIHAKLILNIY